MRKLRSRALAVTLSMVLLSAGGPTAVTAQDGPTPARIADAAAERAVYGLPADEETVRDLLTSGQDVGTERWGIVLTADEERQLDLLGRMRYISAASEELIPYADRLPNIAGVYVDQQEGGRLVILLTSVDDETEGRLRSMLPGGTRGLDVRKASHSLSDLVTAMNEARHAWAEIAPSQLNSVAVNQRDNKLGITVRPEDLPSLKEVENLERSLGVPVEFTGAEIGTEQACSSRDNCASPLRPGVRIRKGSETSGIICTLAFHVRRPNGDEQALTAGHCGFEDPVTWYHQGFPHPNGWVGNETANMYPADGRDVMRVQVPDEQATPLMYHPPDQNGRNVFGSRRPVEGESICASLGNSNTIDCGTVTTEWTTWGPTGLMCNCVQSGGDHAGLATMGGDSGSPVWAMHSSGPPEIWAIGIHNHADGYFTHMESAVAFWDLTMISN